MSNFRRTRNLPMCSYLPVVDSTLCETENRVGKYMLGKIIGEGRFSSVRKCSDLRAGVGNLAMKILRKNIDDTDAISHVENEAKVLFILIANKRHKNIIAYFDLLHGQKCVYILSERLQTDLYEFLDKHHATIDKNLGGFIISEIVCGMTYLRSLNISHGDLKPENVLVDISSSRLTIQICDFGASMVIEPGRLISARGRVTRGFFAPEVVLCDSHCPFGADLFSLGCIALEIILLEHDFSEHWISSYTNYCEGRDCALSFRHRIQQSISVAKHLVKVSLQPAASQPSLAKSFRYDTMAAKIGMESSIHIIQSCIDFLPSRRLPLEALASCDWCRLAVETDALETLADRATSEVWVRSPPLNDLGSNQTMKKSGASISMCFSKCREAMDGLRRGISDVSPVALESREDRRESKQRPRFDREVLVASRTEEESPRTITDDCIEDVCLDSQDLQILFSEASVSDYLEVQKHRAPSLTPHSLTLDECAVGTHAISTWIAFDSSLGGQESSRICHILETQRGGMNSLSRQVSETSGTHCSAHTVGGSSLFNSTGGWRLPRLGADEADDASFVSTLSSMSDSSSSTGYNDSTLDLFATAEDNGSLRRGLFGSMCSLDTLRSDNGDGSKASSQSSRSLTSINGRSELSKQLEKWSEAQSVKYERTLAAIASYQNHSRSQNMPLIVPLIEIAIGSRSNGDAREIQSGSISGRGGRHAIGQGISTHLAPLPNIVKTVSATGASKSRNSLKVIKRQSEEEQKTDTNHCSVQRLLYRKKHSRTSTSSRLP